MNNQPILFLDIDGPLVTDGSGGKEQAHPDTAVFKPEAVHFVNELVRIAGAKIVVISSWAGHCGILDKRLDSSVVPTSLLRAFSRNGLVNDQFHAVWSHVCLVNHPNVKKQEILDPAPTMRGFRTRYWLKTQGAHSRYAILDDAPCFIDDAYFNPRYHHDWNTPLHPSYVYVNPEQGISQSNFDRALKLLTDGVEEVVV